MWSSYLNKITHWVGFLALFTLLNTPALGAVDSTCITKTNKMTQYCSTLIDNQRSQKLLFDAQKSDIEKQQYNWLTPWIGLITAVVGIVAVVTSVLYNSHSLALTATANKQTADANLKTYEIAVNQREREWEELQDNQFFKYVDLLRAYTPQTRLSGAYLMGLAAVASLGVPLRAILDQLLTAYMFERQEPVVAGLAEVLSRIVNDAVCEYPDKSRYPPRFYAPALSKILNDNLLVDLRHEAGAALQHYQSFARTDSAQHLAELGLSDSSQVVLLEAADAPSPMRLRFVPLQPAANEATAFERLRFELERWRVLDTLVKQLSNKIDAAKDLPAPKPDASAFIQTPSVST
jgi:hypothetical protein